MSEATLAPRFAAAFRARFAGVFDAEAGTLEGGSFRFETPAPSGAEGAVLVVEAVEDEVTVGFERFAIALEWPDDFLGAPPAEDEAAGDAPSDETADPDDPFAPALDLVDALVTERLVVVTATDGAKWGGAMTLEAGEDPLAHGAISGMILSWRGTHDRTFGPVSPPPGEGASDSNSPSA